MTALATGLALLAALLYALASVTQQRSAASVPDRQAGGLRLIRVLIRRPLWWLGVGCDTGGFVAQCAALGLAGGLLTAAARRGPARAMLLAIATGVAYGVTAGLIKAVVSLLDDGLVAVAGAWETYLLAVAALGGTLLQQSAFQAGELSAVLPAVTVGEPLVAAVLGITVLQEQVRADGAEWLLIGLAVVVMVVATAALARASARGSPEVVSPGSR